MLRPGGRFTFTSWAVPDDNVAWRLLFDAIRAHRDLAAANAPPSGGNLGTSAGALPAIEAAVAESAASYRCSDGFAVPIVAVVAYGVKPEA